jgi:hypothetical protein
VILVTGERAEVIMRVAYDSKARFDSMLNPFNALITSIEPGNSGAPAPTRLAAALPTDLAAITPRPKPAPKQNERAAGDPAKTNGGGRNCQVQYRQQVYFIPSGGVSTYMVPYTPAGCR